MKMAGHEQTSTHTHTQKRISNNAKWLKNCLQYMCTKLFHGSSSFELSFLKKRAAVERILMRVASLMVSVKGILGADSIL